jgi:cytochrome c553
MQEVQADAALSANVLKLGRRAAAVCANCHGENGISLKLDTPNLAGQNAAYLLEQMRKFATGLRRNEFMEGMIKAMNADEKIGLVMFYSKLNVLPRAASDHALAEKGKNYFVKVCSRCHGDDGHGNEKIARLAGQQPDYVRTALKNYRAGNGIRIDPLMAANTKLLTDADIDAVVAYVGTMK